MNMQPSSFCTICTGPSKYEAMNLLRSLNRTHPNICVHVLCDVESFEHLRAMPATFHVNLAPQKIGRNQRDNKATKFFMHKADVIDYAIDAHGDTMYLDADQIVLERLHVRDGVLGVSPTFFRDEVRDRIGQYSGGLMWVASKKVTKKWRELAKYTKYVDQGAIELLVDLFPSFSFDIGYNFRCWMWRFAYETPEQIKENTKVYGSLITYHEELIRTVHTHFDEVKFGNFNHWIVQLLKRAGRDEVVSDIRSLPSIVSTIITK